MCALKTTDLRWLPFSIQETGRFCEWIVLTMWLQSYCIPGMLRTAKHAPCAILMHHMHAELLLRVVQSTQKLTAWPAHNAETTLACFLKAALRIELVSVAL